MSLKTSKVDVLTIILELRPDLQSLFGKNAIKNDDAYLNWLITSGIKEYKALYEDSYFHRLIVKLDSSSLLTLIQRCIYLIRPDVRDACPLPSQYKSYIKWFNTHGVKEYGLKPLLEAIKAEDVVASPLTSMFKGRYFTRNPKSNIKFGNRPFGVNLIGYAFGQLGIGEDVRMAARSLLEVNIPFTILNFEPGANIPQNDRSLEKYVSDDGKYSINIFCLTAPETGRYFAENGCSQFVNRYNIGYWPWELSKWPKSWNQFIDLVDEVWASTRHIYDAISPVSHVPVSIMPMAVDIDELPKNFKTQDARIKYNLPLNSTLFCFSFDLNSSVFRKNPGACISAFFQAFPMENDNVGLVIKTHKPSTQNDNWDYLKSLATKDQRIFLIEETLSRHDILSLYKSCDCFISLHRAEGFGRGIAEALQLGLHVITTGYSGNTDFCKGDSVDLVDYKLININENEYPYYDSQVWAEPDISHAATLMNLYARKKDNFIYQHVHTEFLTENIGTYYKQRLERINSWGRCND